MARYIDADKLIAHLKDEIEGCKQPLGSRANGKSIAYGTELGLKSAISFVETLATADVVPKSEVEEIIKERELNRVNSLTAKFLLEDSKARYESLMAEHDREVAREIFEEIERILNRQYHMNLFGVPYDVIPAIAELKKKYTESERTEAQTDSHQTNRENLPE